MNAEAKRYCLDANVLIQAWQKYYSPQLCPNYWNILIELGKRATIFIPELVHEEIIRTEDDLAKWLNQSEIPIFKITEPVTKCLQKIYAHDPIHRTLVDSTKSRSIADPWVIAHAMNEGAVVVTKEEKITQANARRIKIPNVCDNMGVKWINDYELLKELGVSFSCRLP